MNRPRLARLTVRVVPRAGRDVIDGAADGRLRVRVAAPPADGAANAALVRLVAEALGVPPTTVRITRGSTARDKVLEIDGLDPAAIADRWPGIDA